MAVVILLYLLAEVAAIWAVASAVGGLVTILLLIAGAVAGTLLARREGAKVMRAMVRTANTGGSPAREISEGMLVGLGGVLILIPGFISDVIGLSLLVPPTRRLLHGAWLRRSERRMSVGGRWARGRVYRARSKRGASTDDSAGFTPGSSGEGGVVIEGEIVDEPQH